MADTDASELDLAGPGAVHKSVISGSKKMDMLSSPRKYLAEHHVVSVIVLSLFL